MIEDMLAELIRYKTVTHDHKENERALSWVKRRLAHLPIHTQDHFSGGIPSLTITTQKTKKPLLWLIAHMDVVDGSEKAFQPHIEENKLYGRGAFDMKFAIACYMQLFLELGESLPDYNIGLMLTSDEETGGANGAGSLAKKGYSSRIMLLPDGGENWSIQKSAKGVLQLHIISSGKSAHGARPWLGQNAIELLYAFLVDLKEAFPQEPCGDNDHYHNTLTIGKIEGGQAVNQVPMTASADIDIRYTADTSAAQLKKLIERLQLSHPGIMLSQTATAPSYQIDKHNLYLSLLVEVMKKEGVIDTPVFINSHGSSDARYFMEKNIPVILLRPVGGGLHSESEWIDIKSIRQFYSIVKQFVMETGKGGDNNGRERNGTGTGSSHR